MRTLTKTLVLIAAAGLMAASGPATAAAACEPEIEADGELCWNMTCGVPGDLGCQECTYKCEHYVIQDLVCVQ